MAKKRPESKLIQATDLLIERANEVVHNEEAAWGGQQGAEEGTVPGAPYWQARAVQTAVFLLAEVGACMKEALDAYDAWMAEPGNDDGSPEPEYLTKARWLLTGEPMREHGCYVMVGRDGSLWQAPMYEDGSCDFENGGEVELVRENDSDDVWLAEVNRLLGTKYTWATDEQLENERRMRGQEAVDHLSSTFTPEQEG